MTARLHEQLIAKKPDMPRGRVFDYKDILVSPERYFQVIDDFYLQEAPSDDTNPTVPEAEDGAPQSMTHGVRLRQGWRFGSDRSGLGGILVAI